eukprot:6491312-Amphidinium_carterae.3
MSSSSAGEQKETKLLQVEWESLRTGIAGPRSQKCPQSMAMRALLDHFRTWSEEEIFATVAPETGMTLFQHILRDKQLFFDNDPGCPKFSCVYYDNLTAIYAAKTNPLKAIKPSVREGAVSGGLRQAMVKAKQNSREELMFYLRTSTHAPTEHDIVGLYRYIAGVNMHGSKDQLETGLSVMRYARKHEIPKKYPSWEPIMLPTWELILTEVARTKDHRE